MRVLLLAVGLLPVSLFGQFDSVDFHNLDIDYLAALIKEKVDRVRQAHGSPPLHLDMHLQQAATDQANYLCYKDRMSHYQPGRSKRDVLDRAIYFGARNIRKAGENIMWKYPRRLLKWNYDLERYEPHFYYTYDRLASEIVQGWVNSPRHFHVMLLPEFRFTGIGVAFDREEITITAVQVFGEFR